MDPPGRTGCPRTPEPPHSKNAAVLAAQMLATGDSELLAKVATYKKNMVGNVQEMDARVQKLASDL